MVETLAAQGFPVAKHSSGQNGNPRNPLVDHRGIWLGRSVPLSQAVAVIRTARDYFPHLDYLDLSHWDREAPERVHHQIFIGGATQAALHRGLRPMSSADFDQLLATQTLEDLHQFLRSFQ
ncbi:MAG: hypothetical protein AAFQ98_04215 [Bacteroidota bacterium]